MQLRDMLSLVWKHFLVLVFCFCVGISDQHHKKEAHEWLFYVEGNGERMVIVSVHENKIQDCFFTADSFIIRALLEKEPNADVKVLEANMMNQMTKMCIDAKWTGVVPGEDGAEVFQRFGIFSGIFIYPGTKWCGAGNISESYDDLGPEIEADLCCREHDYCNDSIGGFETKCDLENDSPFTKSHCDCDDTFHNCLREANTRASNRIGRMFFNVLQMECFRQEFPITGCKKHIGWIRQRCQEYVYDSTKDPIWQMFDAKVYESKSTDEENEIGDTKTKDVFQYVIDLAEKNEGYFLPFDELP